MGQIMETGEETMIELNENMKKFTSNACIQRALEAWVYGTDTLLDSK